MSNKILHFNNNILQYVEKKTNNVDPILELYNGKLYCNIIKYFITECIHNFGTKIFSIKKSYQRTITNILSSWMFSLYATNTLTTEYFFPRNYENTSILEDILNDLCKYDTSIINKHITINKVLSNLKQYYKFQLDILDKYIVSDLYLNNKYNYTIKKYKYQQKRNDSWILFYKFKISIRYIIHDKRLHNLLDNILIPITIYDKLVNKYTGPIKYIDDYIWAIIYRYQLLGSNNHQLAVLPTIMTRMNVDYNLDFECFASSINATFPHYCSIYYDLERYFGSVGNFFEIEPIKGTFGFNPPYQIDIIKNGLNKILILLEETKHKLTFIITIPIWDTEGKSEINQLSNETIKQNIDYGDFEIIKTIKKSKFFICLKMISKDNFTYIDHNFLLFKNKTIQNTYVIILSNDDISQNALLDYNFYTYAQ
jgi:hypothetical protein